MRSAHTNADKAHARTERTRQAVKEELRHLMEDVEELTRRVGDSADPEIDLLRSKAQAAIASAREAIDEGRERARHRAREVVSAGSAYVHERPWRFAGMVGLLGMVVGFLATRR